MSATSRITGIGDEAAIALSGQLATAHDLGWSALELRTIGNTPLGELDSCEVAHLARSVRKSGLDIACLDSRIGNWARPVTTPFAADLRELDTLSEQCIALGTRYVRIMSYPNDGLTENEWRDRVLERVARLTARARERGLVLLHENCAGWAGADPGRMLQLIDAAGSASLQLLFDTGNGIGYGYDAAELLPALLPHIAHVHVKDGVGTPGNVQYVLPGDGRARVSTCLNWLLAYGYTGFFSLEPHLITRPHESSTADETAPERFAEACYQLRHLLDQAAPTHAPGGAPRPSVLDERCEVPRMLTPADADLLVRLLETPTVGPLETGPTETAPQLWQAQRMYARAAEEIGLRTVQHAEPAAHTVLRADVPKTVRQAAVDVEFLAQQPSLVLRLGPAELPRSATVMFNVHMDTVAGVEPVSTDAGWYRGRGAIDAKGPAVALLAGIRDAVRNIPALGRDVGVLVQVVSGEEGGAMGTFGTRPLVEDGFVGRLNVFCEPTGLRYLPRSTASMTARLSVEGDDAVDDHPDAGHNATVLLGHLAQHLAEQLDPRHRQGRLCIAGIGTGELHNRVYGTGGLLLNLSYATSAEGGALITEVDNAVADGITRFATTFAGTREFDRTARQAADVTRLEWLKRDLPSLHNTDRVAEQMLHHAGVARWPDDEPAFTCDAIWMDGVPGAYTVVLGPGSLGVNCAHATGEYAGHAELDAFAAIVSNLLVEFTEQCVHTSRRGTTHDRPA